MARSKNTSQSASSSSKVRARELEIRALEYRKAGASYEQISKALGCSKAGAWKAVKRGLDSLNKECCEKAREVRHIETLRLDRMWAGVYDDAASGDTRAVNAALRIMERRARLWGLDEHTEEGDRERKEIVFKLIGKTDGS